MYRNPDSMSPLGYSPSTLETDNISTIIKTMLIFLLFAYFIYTLYLTKIKEI